MFKYYGTEHNKMTSFIIDWYNLIMDSEKNPLSNIAAKFLRSKGNTIEGGTSEVQPKIFLAWVNRL